MTGHAEKWGEEEVQTSEDFEILFSAYQALSSQDVHFSNWLSDSCLNSRRDVVAPDPRSFRFS